jgi:hypothetical protein
MTASQKPYLDILRETKRCRPDVEASAAKLADLSPETIDNLVKTLIRSGEDTTLGILFNICAFNEVRLDPAVAAEALKVVEPITDFAPVYKFQDKAAIRCLLDITQDEELSTERQVYAGLIAAEMSVFHAYDAEPVRRVLNKLETTYGLTPMLEMMLAGAQGLMAAEQEEVPTDQFLTQTPIVKLLPKEKPPVIIASGQTMRRPVKKTGRNEPCPCGSGKKYKKCCLSKEHELLRDASSHAGVTMSQLRASPRLVDDDQFIYDMRAYELKKLVPATLNARQLYTAYRRCELFGLRELAFDMLQELAQRPDIDDFDDGHYQDLMDSAMDAGDIDLAERIRGHIPPDALIDPELTALQFDLLRDNPSMEKLDTLLRRELTSDEDAFIDPPLLNLSFKFAKTLPALSIVFARAYICANPERGDDNEFLLETVRRARAEIGIEAWDDPIEDYVEWSLSKDIEEIEEKEESEKIDRLIEDVESARKQAREKEKELRRRERMLETLSAQLRKEKDRSVRNDSAPINQAPEPTAREKDTVLRLRQRIERLKAEITSQQQIRRDMRAELRSQREKSLKLEKTDAPLPNNPAATPADAPRAGKTVLVPEYSTSFRRACKIVPSAIAAKAIKVIGEFAAADEAIWRITQPIQRIDQCYRIRVGRGYRILLRWEPDKILQVLDLIPRGELEAWIRKNG